MAFIRWNYGTAFLRCALLLAAGTAEARKTQMHFTPATAPEIRFVGRSATGPDGERSFDWSGTYFTFRFEGRRCAMRASDTKRNYYNIFIDGRRHGTVAVAGGDTTILLADGLSQMLASVGLDSAEARRTTYGLIILAVSTFCMTSLDTATRLGRYMFQELWLAPGQSSKDVRGWRAVLTNKYVATLITVVLGMSLGFGGYAKIWPLFGAANQLLAALALLAVACWLQDLARRNGMFLLPMLFMLLVTLTSLVLTIREQGGKLLAGTGGFVAGMQAAIAALLLLLSLVLVWEGWQALRGRHGRRAAARARD